jgi:hypothetical protein
MPNRNRGAQVDMELEQISTAPPASNPNQGGVGQSNAPMPQQQRGSRVSLKTLRNFGCVCGIIGAVGFGVAAGAEMSADNGATAPAASSNTSVRTGLTSSSTEIRDPREKSTASTIYRRSKDAD